MKSRALSAVGIAILSVSICASISIAAQIDASLLNSIKYARDQAMSVGTDIWPNYEIAPFGFLITLEDREILFCHNSYVEGFKSLPVDRVTNCDLQERTNVLPKNLLAAMPAFDGVSTIVMGTPKSTGRTRAEWIRAIFHEHFHQYQSKFNNYYGRLNDLGLSNGDTTGMWMLNYQFPYKKEIFVANLDDASHALHSAIMSKPPLLQQQVSHYLQARQKLEMSVSANDWKYFELQLWTEGVARWTDIEISERTSDREIVESGKLLREQTISALLTLDPAQSGRGIAYTYGVAEAILLERCKPNWRREYPDTMDLGSMIKKINLSNCH